MTLNIHSITIYAKRCKLLRTLGKDLDVSKNRGEARKGEKSIKKFFLTIDFFIVVDVTLSEQSRESLWIHFCSVNETPPVRLESVSRFDKNESIFLPQEIIRTDSLWIFSSLRQFFLHFKTKFCSSNRVSKSVCFCSYRLRYELNERLPRHV